MESEEREVICDKCGWLVTTPVTWLDEDHYTVDSICPICLSPIKQHVTYFIQKGGECEKVLGI